MIYPTDLVLIAVLNNRRDFEVIRLLGWYRIPLRFAPKIVDVDAIAFYQTARFRRGKMEHPLRRAGPGGRTGETGGVVPG